MNPGAVKIPLFKVKVEEKGRIKDIKEIVCRIQGLPTCLNGQIVKLGPNVRGIIMGFDEEDVLVLVLGDQSKLRMGGEVTGVSEPFKIPVGEKFVGRVITAVGELCDQGDEIEADDFLPVFRDSPPITSRSPVDAFMPSGTKVVDIAIPLAKGQRQLILGDRMTGKTVVALDAIINQIGEDCICIYCCVGKSMSALEKVVTTLHDTGALSHTIVMVALDNAPAGEQYIVPFAAASMGDFFASRGADVLVVFDDLTKHAWAYRQLSLLLERPPGREAYPGDIFYVQTQLMERAGNFSESYGGGSMTFLGIAETLQGDLTGYIPSNLASMCDGQIYMSSTIFAEGFRPAIDFTLSLSIIGGRVQPPILRDLSRRIRADYARYLEVVKLSKLQSGLSEDAKEVINTGQAIMSIFQQGQHHPVGLAEEVLLVYGVVRNIVTKLSERKRDRFRKEILAFALDRNPSLLSDIEERMELDASVELQLRELLDEYVKGLKKEG